MTTPTPGWVQARRTRSDVAPGSDGFDVGLRGLDGSDELVVVERVRGIDVRGCGTTPTSGTG